MTKRYGWKGTVAGAGFFTVMLIMLPLLSAAAPRVIGGGNSSDDEYPWMAALYDVSYTPYDGQFCGGALVHPSYVLTAAHCVTGVYPEEVGVVIGRTKLSSAAGVTRRVNGVLVHPEFDRYTLQNDIALLLLESPVEVPTVSIIAPGEENLWQPGTLATLLGWGTTDPDFSVMPDTLQEAEIPIISDAACLAAMGRYFDAAVMMCAGILGAEPGQGVDACYGDSGGPLAVNTADGWKLLATVSWGFECASDHLYGVFARLAPFHDWVTAWPTLPPALRYDSEVSIHGTLAMGETLTCDHGAWLGSPVESFSYRWLRASGEASSPSYIAGAHGADYVLGKDDLSYLIGCEVTAKNTAGESSAFSLFTEPIAAFPGAPRVELDARPFVSGTTAVGETLYCSEGSWNGTVDAISRKWLRMQSPGAAAEEITGAEAAEYTLSRDDANAFIFCRVTAANALGSVSYDTDAVGPVSALTLSDFTAPSVKFKRLSCRKKGRCKLFIRVDDGGQSSGLRSVEAVLSRVSCSNGGRCGSFKPRWLQGRLQEGEALFVLPALPAGRYLALVSAADNNGNVSTPPARVRIRR